MIEVAIERGPCGGIRAFTAANHGPSEVCAAVSVLVINTVNSIEALTGEAFTCSHEDGGFIQFAMDGPPQPSARLLLDAMALGLRSIAERYSGVSINEYCHPKKMPKNRARKRSD